MNPIVLPINELKPALTGLGKAISRTGKLPVLHHIKVERTKDGWICLTSTDLDIFITVRMEQPVKGEPVSMLLPFEDMVKAVKTGNKGESIFLEPAGKDLVIMHQGEIQNRITTIPTDEFPPVPKIHADGIPLPDQVRQVIHQAMQCSSEDPTRSVLLGAFIDVSQSKAQHIIATDGRHLYNANSWNLPLKSSLIIPKHKFLAWSEFNKDGEWQLKVEIPMLQINSRRWRFITRQIEGKYPNWRQVLPDPSKTRSNIIIEPAALPKLIQTIERMPCDNPEHFTIGLEWKDQRLTLLGRAPDAKEWTKVMIPDVKGDGNNVTVFLNRQFLSKALEFGLNSIGIIDPMTPLRLHQGSREMIVMPVRPEVARANGTPKALPVPATSPRPPRRRLSNPRDVPVNEALDQVGTLRDSFRAGLGHLRDLAAKLKNLKKSER